MGGYLAVFLFPLPRVLSWFRPQFFTVALSDFSCACFCVGNFTRCLFSLVVRRIVSEYSLALCFTRFVYLPEQFLQRGTLPFTHHSCYTAVSPKETRLVVYADLL